jgi:hypothetical protein
MSVNLQMVEELNRKSQQLNAQRQQQIGRQEATRNAYEKAVLAYQQKYGVLITEANLQQECNAVQMQLEKDYNALNESITNIETGKYKIEQQQERERKRQEEAERLRLEEEKKALELSQQALLNAEASKKEDEALEGSEDTVPKKVMITPDMLSVQQAQPVQSPIEFDMEDMEERGNLVYKAIEPEQVPTIQPKQPTPVTFGESTQPVKKEGFTYESASEDTVNLGWGNNGKLDINAQFNSILGGK